MTFIDIIWTKKSIIKSYFDLQNLQSNFKNQLNIYCLNEKKKVPITSNSHSFLLKRLIEALLKWIKNYWLSLYWMSVQYLQNNICISILIYVDLNGF